MRAVDLFCGWGGSSLGAEQAGACVVWAANHWEFAVHAHAQNHPTAQHEALDLRLADWSRVPAHELLLASPSCRGHTTASQPERRPYHDALRATAWVVVEAAEMMQPEWLIVENVPAFTRWKLFDLWCKALERIGYTLSMFVMNAAKYNVPQRRKRIFIVGGPAVVSKPKGSSREMPFGPCVDWDAGDWRHIDDASHGAQDRIHEGQLNHGERFLTQHVTNHPGVPLYEPIRTITTKDQWAVVDGDFYRPLTVQETARAMGFPDDYRWPANALRRDCIKGLGNAVPPQLVKAIVQEVQHAV